FSPRLLSCDIRHLFPARITSPASPPASTVALVLDVPYRDWRDKSDREFAASNRRADPSLRFHQILAGHSNTIYHPEYAKKSPPRFPAPRVIHADICVCLANTRRGESAEPLAPPRAPRDGAGPQLRHRDRRAVHARCTAPRSVPGRPAPGHG